MHHHHHDPNAEFGGSPNGRQSLGSAAAAASPNEHLYSSLYGREMELMRKMFKANEKSDTADNGNYDGGGPLRSGNGGANFGSYTSPIFGGNAAKYFEGLHSAEQHAHKFGGSGAVRSDLFEHNVHSSNSGQSAGNKSQQAALMGEKHFGMHFANNNNNIMNLNQNLSDATTLASSNNRNTTTNNNNMHSNLKSFAGGFASAHLTSPTTSDPGSTTMMDGAASMHFGASHAMHGAANFHGSPGSLEKGLLSHKIGGDFETATRKTGDDAKALAKLGTKMDEHFLDEELKARMGQHIMAASMLNSGAALHHQSPGGHNHHSNGGNSTNNASNDDEDDDEFTSL